MFAIIVSIKQVATGVCSITLSLCLSVSLSLFLHRRMESEAGEPAAVGL
jgi:hypothetical protein